MLKNSIRKKNIYIFGTLILMMVSLTFTKLEVKAVDLKLKCQIYKNFSSYFFFVSFILISPHPSMFR